MQETLVQSLGWEGALEKEMATCSSILAWKIPWTEESGRPQKSQIWLGDCKQQKAAKQVILYDKNIDM